MSRFAHPVPRKQKKGLDLSKWRELAASDFVPVHLVKKEDDPVLMKCGVKDFRITSSEGDINVSESPESNRHTSGSSVYNKPECGSNVEQTNFRQHSDSVQNHLPTLTAIGTHDGDLNEACAMQMDDAKENEQASTSYMDAIDAENFAVLQKMSSEEILEARDEIEKKLRPCVIEMLRKRGQEKLKRRESIKAGNEAEKHSDLSHDRSCLQEPPNVASQLPSDENSKTRVNSETKNKCSMPDNIGCQPFVGSDSSKWNVWASRVEKVRVLRFSLDFYVMDCDSSLVPAAGGSSVNVSERDFLLTEGDPGGAGYTIKEAFTLIRSMVPGQRAIALRLIASILDKTQCKLHVEEGRCKDGHAEPTDEFIDFEAVWAYALGPEPELVLSLRTYLLEVEQYTHLEEHLISVVTELAKHSPSSFNAIVKCPKLIASVVNRLACKDSMDIHPVMINTLGLLKVLAKSHKQNCEYFMRSGVF